ncbi:hypothetical protein G6F65_022740 [Rhizopus arrhizus]|nr:hypothetical protein G6F65_022740 [Rhizopus arrhizus]
MRRGVAVAAAGARVGHLGVAPVRGLWTRNPEPAWPGLEAVRPLPGTGGRLVRAWLLHPVGRGIGGQFVAAL